MDNKSLTATFIESIGSNSDYTKESYTAILENFTNEVGDMNEMTYEKYLAYKSTLGEYAVASQRKFISVTKEFVEWCFVTYNIGNVTEIFRIQKVKSPRGNSKITQPLTSDEVKLMLANSKNDRDRAIIALCCITGLRVSELINLKLDDIKDGYINICGKGNKYRAVYPNTMVLELIDKYVKGMRANKVAEKGLNTNLVFISNGGEKLLESSLNRTLKCIARKSNINKDIHPHSLRHTCATLMYENGLDVKDIQMNLGHASMATTNRYMHGNVNLMRKKIEAVDLLA